MGARVSAAKRKGDGFEREVARVFREHGHPDAERVLRLGAREDRGDIANVVGFHIDCKARADVAHLSTWVDEGVREVEALRVIAQARVPGVLVHSLVPVVVVKRMGKPAERAYAVVELATFAELMR
jgi:hypothetical protein